MKRNSIYFISDVHLSPHFPDHSPRFSQFIHQYILQSNTQALYILGDLFDLWIGDDDTEPYYQAIIKLLKQVTTSGVNCYLMHGNHDFLIGTAFCQQTGCQLLPSFHSIDLFGQKTLLLHGDELCTDDVNHQMFRQQVILNKAMHADFLQKSLSERMQVAQFYLNKSEEAVAQKSASIMDVAPAEVLRVFNKYKVNFMIHGHTHRPGWQTIESEREILTRVTLGDWFKTPYILLVEENKKPRLFELDL